MPIEPNREQIADAIKAIDGVVGSVKSVRDELSGRMDQIETAMQRPGLALNDDDKGARWDGSDEQKAFGRWLRSGKESELDVGELKALATDSDPDGGFRIPTAVANRIIAKVHETSPLRALAAVVPTSAPSMVFPIDNERAVSGWVGEHSSRPETATPKIGEKEIKAHEIYALPFATQRMIDDANWSVESWLAEKVSQEFSLQENAAFVSGDGVAKPRGFLTYPTALAATWEWGKLEHVATGASGTFNSTDPADVLYNCQAALKAAYRPNAAWLMNRATANVVRKFKDQQDRYLWQDSLQAGQPNMLLGHPVYLGEDMPNIEANSLSIAFGDFRAGYTILDRIGIRTLRDPYTAKPKVGFYSTKRVGGDVLNFEALKIVKFAS